MTPEDREMLIRVDQNVVNLMTVVASHIKEDKENFKTLNDERNQRVGVARLAGVLYTLGSAVIGMIIGIKYGSR